MRVAPPTKCMAGAEPVPDVPLLAGSGGLLSDDTTLSHANRKAVLLTRDADTAEFEALAATLGIEVVEVLRQSGSPDPRTHMGRGRLEGVGDELASRLGDHPWAGVDLVLVHATLLPRQLVNIHDVLTVEVWDRVRLLLELFTKHAASVEARTQVRIARLAADRLVLRELVRRVTTGERLGYGAGGRHGWRGVLETVNREVTSLRRRQRRHASARKERRRQRARSGALTIGLAGYTNAGKSSLFAALSGKQVLVEDRLFSTLETTVGRMQASPRLLLVDTIGFIEQLPSDLLDAFSATLMESLECDLLLLLADASDLPAEIRRRLKTCQRELAERMDIDERPAYLVVLTKVDLIGDDARARARESVLDLGMPDPLLASTVTGEGLDELRQAILNQLHGSPRRLRLHPPTEEGDVTLAALIAELYERGLPVEHPGQENDGVEAVELECWIDAASLGRMQRAHPRQVESVSDGEQG